MMRMGPNDSEKVVWAFGESPLSFFLFILDTTNLYFCFAQAFNDCIKDARAGDDEYGPEQLRKRLFGHLVSFFCSFLFF